MFFFKVIEESNNLFVHQIFSMALNLFFDELFLEGWLLLDLILILDFVSDIDANISEFSM